MQGAPRCRLAGFEHTRCAALRGMLSMLCHALQPFGSLALVMHQGSLAKQLLNKQWLQEDTEAGSQGSWDDYDSLAVAASQAVVLQAFLPSQQALDPHWVSSEGSRVRKSPSWVYKKCYSTPSTGDAESSSQVPWQLEAKVDAAAYPTSYPPTLCDPHGY